MATSFTPTSEMVDAVHAWRAMRADSRIRRPLVPLIIDRFKVTPVQAVAIIRAAKEDADATS